MEYMLFITFRVTFVDNHAPTATTISQLKRGITRIVDDVCPLIRNVGDHDEGKTAHHIINAL